MEALNGSEVEELIQIMEKMPPPPPGEEVCLFLGQVEFHVLIAGGRTEQLIPQFGRSWFRASGMTISPLSALSRLTYRSDRRDRQGTLAARKTGPPRADGGEGQLQTAAETGGGGGHR